MKPIHHPKSNAEDRNQKSMPTMIADIFMFIPKSEYFGYLVFKCKHFGCNIFHTKTHLRKNSWRGTGTRVVSLVATLLALLTHFFWIIISPLSFELLSTLNSNQHFVLLTFFSTSLQNLLIFLHAEASLEPTSVSGLVGQSLNFHVYISKYIFAKWVYWFWSLKSTCHFNLIRIPQNYYWAF